MSTYELIFSIFFLFLLFWIRMIQLRRSITELRQTVSTLLLQIKDQEKTFAELVKELDCRITKARESNQKDWDLTVNLLNSTTRHQDLCDKKCADLTKQTKDMEVAIYALQHSRFKPKEVTAQSSEITPIKDNLAKLQDSVVMLESHLARQSQRTDCQSRKINKLWHKITKLQRK